MALSGYGHSNSSALVYILDIKEISLSKATLLTEFLCVCEIGALQNKGVALSYKAR